MCMRQFMKPLPSGHPCATHLPNAVQCPSPPPPTAGHPPPLPTVRRASPPPNVVRCCAARLPSSYAVQRPSPSPLTAGHLPPHTAVQTPSPPPTHRCSTPLPPDHRCRSPALCSTRRSRSRRRLQLTWRLHRQRLACPSEVSEVAAGSGQTCFSYMCTVGVCPPGFP